MEGEQNSTLGDLKLSMESTFIANSSLPLSSGLVICYLVCYLIAMALVLIFLHFVVTLWQGSRHKQSGAFKVSAQLNEVSYRQIKNHCTSICLLTRLYCIRIFILALCFI